MYFLFIVTYVTLFFMGQYDFSIACSKCSYPIEIDDSDLYSRSN